MNFLIFIAVASSLALGALCKKEGYPYDGNNCRYICFRNQYCDDLCKKLKGESGYCYGWNQSCYCYGLPDTEKTKPDKRCHSKG
uniref:Neurotoxin LmNaTx10 n=1 Tax=Lychas mucronatus TaxID=172552 RepID=SNAAA_LYCMC|nr:RecName: Full=Neurotoxin LmNaTx10; Flags: Precursor [Lychas mucronatus]ABX76758.1 neurotoxin LmNaTx10 precursor [Lychas mucronatus]